MSDPEKSWKFSTIAIHAGNKSDQITGSISPPIHLTSTFEQDGVGKDRGYDYSRVKNPTRERLEINLAALEKGKYAIAFASGMAATTALFQLFDAEDNIIISRNTYGGTYRMAMQVLNRQALTFNWVDSRDPAKIEAAINPHTKLVYVETPTNPMLEICDIRAVSDICRRKGILLAVDNTFMSPYGQRPLEFGTDVVMHSSTKYLGGHSDIIGGALIMENRELYEKLHFIQKSTGAVPGPFDAWLILRSTKTLGLRYQQAADNALELARWMDGLKQVQGVIYPGLENHAQHKLAALQQRTPRGESIFGSIISIYLETIETRDRFLKKLKIFTFAESLGGVESLVSIPFAMTHSAVPIKEKLALGITETLVRFSIGIEDVEDLMEDIKQALD